LEVWGDFACFTRPELKVERVSYDVITPSAARAIFDAILWKPAIKWEVTRIDVLAPIKWASVRRNEVGAVASTGKKCIYIDDGKTRQQRASLLLRDVRYRIYAKLVFISNKHREESERRKDPNENPAKYYDMFTRRASKGQCFNQPYLGTREFAASFRLVEDNDTSMQPIDETRDLGLVHYDMDFCNNMMPMYFRANMEHGVIMVPSPNSEEVLR
jgi:CRISPR-associated protein Cas5d